MWYGLACMVLRTISTRMPSLGRPDLPLILNAVTMRKRGLMVVAGATGSGKSTRREVGVDAESWNVT
ncbi:hypothetical protein CJO92_22800 (plasmid) [Ralstonia solanacearum]|uniref:Uncharacterized protein n=2 Tax=Ralstonia solanacearum TaxID=305 RepID=A0AAD0SE20_RALSL|nr:hypothetical protein [Ralstonia solanacearum]AXV84775.1 hypothetical protein CJO77_22785 [Ralstonia solanacearum]AXW55464.1 hypothetical protein CJO92_22800 [Ralstonia solanacearum]CBJ35651.1 hypothethical protein [Ralstonia solanacearum PSI07]